MPLGDDDCGDLRILAASACVFVALADRLQLLFTDCPILAAVDAVSVVQDLAR